MTVTATVTAEYTVRLVTDDTQPGQWFRVSGQPDRLIGVEKTTEDRWAPLNVALSYYWVSTGGVQQTSPVTVTAHSPVLSSAMGGGSATVTVISQPPLRWEGRSVAHPILGRNDPLVTVQRPLYHSADLVLHASTATQRAAIRGLLRTGQPLILRSTCPDAVDDVTMLPQSWAEELGGPAPAGPRSFTVQYQAVMDQPTLYTELPAWAWVDLAAEQSSWTNTALTYPTWDTVTAGPA